MTISDYIMYQKYIKEVPLEKRATLGYAAWRALTAVPRIFPWMWNTLKGTATGGKKLLSNLGHPIKAWNESKGIVPIVKVDKAGNKINVQGLLPESSNFSKVQTIKNRRVASPDEIQQAISQGKTTVDGKIIPSRNEQIRALEDSYRKKNPKAFKRALTDEERRALGVAYTTTLITGGLLHGVPENKVYKPKDYDINSLIENIGLPKEKQPF